MCSNPFIRPLTSLKLTIDLALAWAGSSYKCRLAHPLSFLRKKKKKKCCRSKGHIVVSTLSENALTWAMDR